MTMCEHCRYWERVVIPDDVWELSPTLRMRVKDEVVPIPNAESFGVCLCLSLSDTSPILIDIEDDCGGTVFTPLDWGCASFAGREGQ